MDLPSETGGDVPCIGFTSSVYQVPRVAVEAGEETRVSQSRLFGALIRGRGMAPHGFIPEAAPLVSIAPTHLLFLLFPVVFFCLL